MFDVLPRSPPSVRLCRQLYRQPSSGLSQIPLAHNIVAFERAPQYDDPKLLILPTVRYIDKPSILNKLQGHAPSDVSDFYTLEHMPLTEECCLMRARIGLITSKQRA